MNSGSSLELTANEGEKIYYTTDGTDPRTSATREEYTAPIEIKDRSNDPNVVSAVPTEMISGNFNEFSFGEGDFWCNKKAPSDNAVDKSHCYKSIKRKKRWKRFTKLLRQLLHRKRRGAYKRA